MAPTDVKQSAPPVPAEVLERVTALYDAGRYVTAYAEATAHAPLESWRDSDGRILAGRLIRHVGDPRRGLAWLRLAMRADPRHPAAHYYGSYAYFSYRGPLAAWQWTERNGLPPDADPEREADWLALRGILLGFLRDFQQARPRLERALELQPESPWVHVERAQLFELEDQVPAALESTSTALELHPGYRPALQSRVHLLGLLDRTEEALALLREWAPKLECGGLWVQLGSLLEELERPQEAREAFERVGELFPALGKDRDRFLNARLSDATYLCGDVDGAIELARKAGKKEKSFHTIVAEAMQQNRGAPRKRLAVGFVRQDYMTCAPASVTMLANFFGLDLDHEDVAEAICYDGTPAHAQRSWAREQGWLTREFAVTWDNARALLDREIPFAISTVEATSAHMQVVMGYDACRQTLLVRDPNSRHTQEFLVELWFEHYRAFGPRGVLLLPQAEAARLDGLELDDSERFDLLYEVEAALHAHDRAQAGEALARLLALGAEHRIALWARRVVAAYDSDTVTALECLDALSAQFPKQKKFMLDRVDCLEERGTHAERRELLEGFLSEQEDEIDPVFWWRLGAELQEDPDELDRAEDLLRRAIRYRPLEARLYLSYAHLISIQGRPQDALPLYRFAACLAPRAEGFAQAYFRAARQCKATEQALAMLAERVERHGVKSSESARTLFSAYHTLDRTDDAFALLRTSLELRPDDGELLLFAAEVHARHGKREEAEACLERAAGKVNPRAQALAAAEVARFSGDLRGALEHTREALRHDPRSVSAHASLAGYLAQAEGLDAACAHLAEAVAAEPEFVPLSRLYLEWLSEAPDPAPAAEALRTYLERHPLDAWARRQLALQLASLGDFDGALREAQQARHAAPRESTGWTVEGQVLRLSGSLGSARRAYREAIALNADDRAAISGLLACSLTPEELEDAAGTVRAALLSQPITGQGILGYAYACRGRIVGDAQLAFFQRMSEVHGARWEAWSAWVDQLLTLGRTDEAVEVGSDAVQRFPLRGELWLDLARARRDAGQLEAACEALRHVLVIDPGQTRAAGLLAELLQENGNLSQAEEALRDGLASAPRHPYLTRVLAEVLHALGRDDEALETVRACLEFDPHDDDAWGYVFDWSGDPEVPARWARELAEARPRDVEAWVRAARFLPPDRTDERLALLERAEATNPRDVELHDNRALILCEAERFDEARAACAPDVFEELPLPLRGRAAWILHREGDEEGAKAQMRELLREAPDYGWGLRELAEWCHKSDDAEGQIETARRLLALDPRDHAALTHLAAGHEKRGELDEAREHYNAALEVNRRAYFAAQSLVDLELEAENLDAAAQALELLELHLPDPFVNLRRIRLETKRKGRGAGLRALRELYRHAEVEAGLLRHATELCAEAGWDHVLWRVFKDALAEPRVHPVVGWLWARNHADAGRWDWIADELDGLRERTPALAQQALEAYVERLGERGRPARLQGVVERYREWLRGDDGLWASAGYALGQADLDDACVRWMHDWTERDGQSTAWAWLNLALAARGTGREALAREVARHALEHDPHPVRQLAHWAWLRYDASVLGQPPVAAPEVEVGDEDLPSFHRFAFLLAQAAEAGPQGGRAQLSGLRSEAAFFLQSSLLVGCYLQALQTLAKAGLLLWLWAWWVGWRVQRQARQAQAERAARR